MSGLRSFRTLRPGLGLLLGLLLAAGPMIQPVVAMQRPCGRAPVQSEAPAEAPDLGVDVTEGRQWTCPQLSKDPALWALPSERLDGPSHGGFLVSTNGDSVPYTRKRERTTVVPAPLHVSHERAFLRSIVLQI